MRGTRVSLLLLIALLGLAAVGCDEPWCRDKYDLHGPGECEEPPPTPGPHIEILPGTNAQILDVEVDGTVQNTNSTMSVFPDNYPTDPCVLRGDFIGIRKLLFEFQPDVGVKQDATRVTILADNDGDSTNDVQIEIRKSGYNTMRWMFRELTGEMRSCVATVLEEFPGDVLPKQFIGMQSSSMYEQTLGHGTLTEFEVEVDRP